MHLGLIGGIGPAATEHYYRGLVDRHARADTALELTIVHADVRELTRNLANGDARKQAETFASLIGRLAAAGAQAAALTSMGGHFCIGQLEAISPLPIINAIPVVDAAIRERRLKTIGIIGTRTVMETRLYGGNSSAAVVLPEGEALEQVHKSYVEWQLRLGSRRRSGARSSRRAASMPSTGCRSRDPWRHGSVPCLPGTRRGFR